MPSFADKTRRLERIRLQLRRRFGEPPPVAVTHPVEYALRAIVAEEATARETDEAMERIRRHFVDLNDLRVSRPREIRDILGATFPRSAHKARVIPRLLDQVFKRHNTMVWDFLESMGKVQSRTFFEKLEEVRPFVAATLARDCIGAHTFPVDNDVARVLGRLAVVDPSKETEVEMQGFLERAVKANRAYEVHWLIKRLGEDLCIVGTCLCVDCGLSATCPAAVSAPRGKGGRKAKAAAGHATKKPSPGDRKKGAKPAPKKAKAARKK